MAVTVSSCTLYVVLRMAYAYGYSSIALARCGSRLPIENSKKINHGGRHGPRLGHERKHMAHKLTRHIAAAPPAHTHTLRSKRLRVSALSAQKEKGSNRRQAVRGTGTGESKDDG